MEKADTSTPHDANILGEERFRLLVESVEDYAIYMLDPNGIVVSWNPGAQRLKGYTDLEAIGRSFHRFFPPEDALAGKPARLLERALETGKARDEGWRVRKDGTRFRAEVVVTPVRNASGALRGFAKVTRDITDKMALEEMRIARAALEESRERFRALADSVPVLIWMADVDAKCEYFNRTWLEFTGRSMDQERGDGWLEGVHADDQAQCLSTFLESFHARRAFRMEYRLRRRDGEYRWLLESGTPRFETDGSFAGFVGSCIDIHDRRTLEEELSKSQDQLSVILHGVENAITTLDPQGNMVFANQAAARQMGFSSPQELLSTPPRKILERFEILDENGGPFPVEDLPSRQAMLGKRHPGIVMRYRIKATGEDRWSIVKASPVFGEGGKVVLVINFFQDITDLKTREMEERKTKEQLRIILEGITDAIVVQDPAGKLLYLNLEGARIMGFPTVEAVHAATNSPDLEKVRSRITIRDEAGRPFPVEKTPGRLALKGEEPPPMVLRVRMNESEPERWLLTRARPARDSQGKVLFSVTILHDFTARKETEELLRQSQKMEAIGKLAGGIAHDFNNLLTAINGFSALALGMVKEADPLHDYLSEIRNSGERAAALTRQLLAYSRKQILSPKVLNLNTLVSKMEVMLRRLIGEDIDLATRLDPGLGLIMADPGQIEQIILNLALNARDAMPHGGKLTLETGNVELDENYVSTHLESRPGNYAMLAVSDTGTGIPAEIRDKIFEPFFTTKEVGKGTGLGLSSVYGIVKQSGGSIMVYSEAGHGATFKIYLPLIGIESGANTSAASSHFPRPVGGSETILIVEDEDVVRKYVAGVLASHGYAILEARDGAEALETGKKSPGAVHLLVTDVVMPNMNGRKLAEALRGFHPGMKVLFMSGYTENAIVHHGTLDDGSEYLQKPFSPTALARKIREILNAAQD